MTLKCEHQNCTETASEYIVPAYDDDGEIDGNQTLILCDEHATEVGFCPSCGYLVAGIERDDLSMFKYGMCAECFDDLRAEMGEYDHLEYDDYDEPY